MTDATDAAQRLRRTWTADNGNGTYSNPLFYDEFSDPDLIRVREDYYLTGTTMHCMPGLPLLHSRDLVNWELCSYACRRLDLGPEFRMEDGQEIYGQGIWAPCLRHHNGEFLIFSNVNRRHTQLFRAADPAGPWTHTEMHVSLHDLSVLFDDDGKAYVIWDYQDVHFAELTADLKDIVPGTERVILPKSAGAGEGCHFYKINGKYIITSTVYDPVCYMVCARADRPEGPYEVTVISAEEGLGIDTGWRLRDNGFGGPPFDLVPPQVNRLGAIPLHQGGLVETPSGEWWGFSMMHHNSIGRLTCLSPITWANGWPYFGLPGNLGRTPRVWVKPDTGVEAADPHAPYERSDDFSGPELKPVWQWSHVPDDTKWSLTERPGFLRLHSLPAPDFWLARNTLTQRAIGPASTATVELDVARLQPGDVAGLALLNRPYAWIGVAKDADGNCSVQQFDQISGQTVSLPIAGARLRLRVHADFDTEQATFAVSANGRDFQPLGEAFTMVFQLKTFQGVRYALFGYNTAGAPGGYADFRDFTVEEPRCHGLTQPIPLGQSITLTSLGDASVLAVKNGVLLSVPAGDPRAAGPEARFRVVDCGRGRIALRPESADGLIAVTAFGGPGDVKLRPGGSAAPGDAETFQWQDLLRGDIALLSLATNRYLRIRPGDPAPAAADCPGPRPDRKDGSCFTWKIAEAEVDA